MPETIETREKPMKFSLGQAAKEVAKSKATIHRYVQTGRLSADRQDDGSYQIEASELFRVFPHAGELQKPLQNPRHETIRNPLEPHTEHPGNQGATSALTTEIDLLRERLADKDKRLADKDDVIGDLRRRLDRESEERTRLTALLTDQRRAQAEPPSAPPKGLWRRLFGK
jgi:hypothetical protein